MTMAEWDRLVARMWATAFVVPPRPVTTPATMLASWRIENEEQRP